MAMRDNVKAKSRHARIMLWSALVIFFGAALLPLTGYLYVSYSSAQAADAQQTNPRANYWRAIRQGNTGYTAASGAYTTNVLVQNGGENWRQIRNGPVATFTPWIIAAVAFLIALYHLIKGPQKLDQPLSGKTVARWSLGERVLHWYTAILFILLSITGLSILFGRAVLIPLLGLQGFSAWATFAIAVHNYLGPFFVVGVLLEIIVWIRFNIPNKTDWTWFKKGGGMFSGEHVSAGRSNGGEKIWFWIIATVGVAVCVTGLILDFPNLQQSRETMQLSSIIHAVAGMVWVAVALGHIYLGAVGSPGALQGMTKGRVSVEWAKHHHDLWYEEVKQTEKMDTGAGEPSGAAKQPG
ncbi:MAG: formate dehydrogenase subunit gamma [Gammaproteobacteria bacterium]|nr:formate dehydrogenase subunit gamma [Gammaproteobacteria bacterium]